MKRGSSVTPHFTELPSLGCNKYVSNIVIVQYLKPFAFLKMLEVINKNSY